MTDLADSCVYDTASSILVAARSAFTDEELRDYDFQSYVSHGAPAEDCCKLLVSYASNIQVGFGANENSAFQNYGFNVYTTDITVALRECPPMMGDKGEAPSNEELDDYSLLTYTHAWRIIKAINCASQEGSLLPGGTCQFNVPPVAVLIEEQGGCAGWDIQMNVELSSD